MKVLLAHLVGDYLLQSHWMATNKTSRWVPAFTHAAIYTTAYIAVTRSVLALTVIGVTHYLIDRYRLARWVVWLKNHLAPSSGHPKEGITSTGYDSDVPSWLAVWLLIIADNTLHLLINYSAVNFL